MPGKTITFYILLPFFYAILFSSTSVSAQAVSCPSGFYPTDSIFFTVNQEAPKGGKIEISVNCFTTGKCFSEYKTGIWLYNRSNTPNTWEDQQFSRAPDGGAADTIAGRGLLDKVNVIRVRMVSQSGAILSDSAYFIGILGKGAPRPYTLPVVQLLVDSIDAFGPLGFYGPGEGIHNKYVDVWNYLLDETPRYNSYVPRERVEKKCIMQILDKEQHSLLYQNCGIHLTGNESRSLPNKGMEVVARTEYSNSNTFKTNLLEDNTGAYHSIRFRSGGAGQRFGFGAHEIAEKIIAGLNIGEVPVKPVITFLNGSYWSLSFAQAEIEESAPGDILQRESISIFKPQYFVWNEKTINALHNQHVDTQSVTWSRLPHKTIGTAMLMHGNKNLFTPVSEKLLKSVENNTPLSFADIDDLIDLNSWLTYIIVSDFGSMKSSIQHHVFIGTAPGKKMFVMMDDIKDFAMQNPAGNFWKEKALVPDTNIEEKTFSSLLIKEIILKNAGCIIKLCLRYQDLLNTQFKSERTVNIVNTFANSFLPEYEKYWKSWLPNSGRDSTTEGAYLDSTKSYLKARPDIAWQQLADQWLPNDKFQLADRKAVTVILDSVPEGTVNVHLNSLTITRDWSGLYYPDPALEISMEALNVPKGFVLAWKELPDKPTSLKIPAKNEIILTVVLRRTK